MQNIRKSEFCQMKVKIIADFLPKLRQPVRLPNYGILEGNMITAFAQKHQLPAFRITQFNQAFYKEVISSFDELTTWPKELREK
ncbi:hypothetical protein AUK04_00685 [Candidatus Roizmanbacteria bacterium CG2_30_33_16]|uniref:Uncharacterized protein n=5 Tax=Candidatus Roizmaniibacteriota TaxID=1752723 RepID=A0A2M7E4L2_9BACT|nr:hypothetical protein [Candidatus Roizmanbacteria bacterium]OIP86389.1 MAG: hypothetical protein AUK04_00685 [Candidatus Roizmanbacteria bacterium CG2_30_33_16]PIP64318.1 MAG: hypothetical protein COW96_03210 [Candidatus Roizmanbacteria bacterium CG22_combo_CG10-13_8_21_14_all_33_16]PIV62651.1 MAG: hypothetical protein COS12_01605 [Candidatus Roizmanbacteria bacterium CG01_land_8_20_14_3_00_33_9]PIX69928.1 MAG: hypothetical protein COZ39_04925 [Candidatus Roizmanbacteria bacterium CG_4_10_14_